MYREKKSLLSKEIYLLGRNLKKIKFRKLKNSKKNEVKVEFNVQKLNFRKGSCGEKENILVQY